MKYDIFISYSHKDKIVADAIVNYLEKNGFRCWYAPRDIQTGQEWADSIINAISQSKLMVLIFTDFSNESSQVRREVDNAISRGLTIIPFKLTQKPPKGGMEYYLSTLHWLDAMDEPLEKAIEELHQRVSMLLTGQTADTTVPVEINNTFQIKKPLKNFGIISCGLLFFLAFIFVFSGLVTIMDDVSSSMLCVSLGMVIGVPSTVAGLALIKTKKPSHKNLVTAGVIEVISVVALIIFTMGVS